MNIDDICNFKCVSVNGDSCLFHHVAPTISHYVNANEYANIAFDLLNKMIQRYCMD